MGEKNKSNSIFNILVFSALLISIALFAYLVLAAAGDGVRVENPVTGSNFSTNFTVNCSYINDTTEILNPLHQYTTFYVNESGVWQPLFNITSYNITNASVSFVVDITNITDSKGLAFNCTIGNGTEYNISAAPGNISTVITIDDTAPVISTPILPVVGGNYSGNITLNVSVVDATIGIDTVYFNITNSSGGQNGTYTASDEGDYWKVTIDTSINYTDGTYNITVFANDTMSLNSTSVVYSVTFDNTAPTATFSCSPASVTAGETVTCGCAVADATSGVNLSSYSDTTTPSTISLGTFTVTCTPTDNAGNSATLSASYTVTGAGGLGPSGSGTTTWKSTHIVNAEQFQEGFTKSVAVKERFKVKIENKYHYAGVTELTSTTATVEVSSTPQTATLNIGDLKKFDVTEDGYYDVSVKLNSITSSKADITIKSIHEEIPAAPPVESPTELPTEEPEEKITGELPEEAPESLLWLWILIAVVAVIIIIVILIIIKKKKQ